MVRVGFVKCLRTLVHLLLVTTILLVCVVNIKFNMTGFWLVPSPISTTFEKMKTFLRMSENERMSLDKMAPGHETLASKRSLVDVFEGMNIKDKRQTLNGKEPSTKGNLTLYILWFNKPNWIKLNYANRVLTSSVCSYDNCRMTSGPYHTKHAAVIFSLPDELDYTPPVSPKERPRDQVWIFFGLEPPVMHERIKYRHDNWRNTMNWSMTYRRDADIFFPYGMLESRKDLPTNKNYSAIFSRKTKHAAWLVSNCGASSYRDEFVSELQKFGVKVDIFGVCVNSIFRDRYEMTALIHKEYKFYLSFENTLCKDYVTEKLFRYYNLDVVLVVRGGADYGRVLPNDTFINTAHFESARALSKYLLKVASSESLFSQYLRNKDKYTAKEMFEMPTSYCSICEKLNNLNDNRKTYDDHVTFIHEDTCWTSTDVPFKLSTRYVKDFVHSFISIVFLILICAPFIHICLRCLNIGKRKN